MHSRQNTIACTITFRSFYSFVVYYILLLTYQVRIQCILALITTTFEMSPQTGTGEYFESFH